MKSVPYINLPLQHSKIKGELLVAFGRVLDEAQFILGKDVGIFEDNLAHYCGVKYAVGVNSGTDAIFLALKGYHIGEGDEVITAPNSFLATASSIIAAGAKPVFVDIRDDLNINPDLIESKINKKTKAIMPVHLTGKPAEMKPILELAKKYNLRVIEDAAQAIGAEYYNQKIGSIGDVGCFSLHPLKNLNACGDAGAILTNDENLYKTLIQLRNIGMKNRDEMDIWGYNSRLDTLQAALLNVKFSHLDKWTEERRQSASFYSEYLHSYVRTPVEEKNEKCIFHTYVIQTECRDELQHFLETNGIGTKVHYPIPIHLQKASDFLNCRRGDFPVCERVVSQMLSLPIHQDLTEEDKVYVVETVKSFFRNHR